MTGEKLPILLSVNASESLPKTRYLVQGFYTPLTSSTEPLLSRATEK